MTRPNIIFMIADDHRHSAINAIAEAEVRTPTFDKLIAEGTAFTHAHIMGSTSGAVCMPSRGMLLTGRGLFHAFDHSDRRQSVYAIPPHTPLLPEWLRQHGYTTHGIGKWHNRKSDYARSFAGGANIFFGGMSDHDKVPVHDFDPSGAYPNEVRYIAEGFSTDLFADSAIDFLSGYEGDNPFFLYVAFTAPHDPRTPPPEYAYDPNDIPLPLNFAPEHPFDNGELQVRDEKLAPHPRPPEVIGQHIADYYGMISHMDAHIGTILDALAETPHADNTIIVYTADHGLSIGQHGLMGKQNLYDHSIRVPLILRGPGIPAGERIDALCYMPDVSPTLCELVDLPIIPSSEMHSLATLLRGDKTTHRDTLFAAYQPEIDAVNRSQRMVRDGQYKLIEYFINGERMTQLFDLHLDPGETHNLALDADQTERIARLRAELGAWQRITDDPLLMG